MNLSYLIQVLQNKITTLQNAKSQAISVGDLEHANNIEKELLDTQSTFNQLNALADMTQMANSVNSTPTELVASGIKAQSETINPPAPTTENTNPTPENPTYPLSVYNITPYATDPNHEAAITSILSSMGTMITAQDIDTYINSVSTGSPVTGIMVLNAATQYNVDIRLLMAMMQQDSSFGTAGLAISTLNPGNVGNTDDGSTQTFPTWQDGVNAVAEWLNNHRVS